jgi:hypothetical protein
MQQKHKCWAFKERGRRGELRCALLSRLIVFEVEEAELTETGRQAKKRSEDVSAETGRTGMGVMQ